MDAITNIISHAIEGARLREKYLSDIAPILAEASRQTALALARGQKILLCGNGGSAGDAQHLAGELVNRFIIDRPPLAAVALTTDSSVLSAIGNDFGFNEVFAKQVQALGRSGDVLLAISTSGNSPNVIAALHSAREHGLITIGLSGEGGGKMAELCNFMFAVPNRHTPLIQEVHIAIGHLWCGLIDHYLFENVKAIQADLSGGDNNANS